MSTPTEYKPPEVVTAAPEIFDPDDPVAKSHWKPTSGIRWGRVLRKVAGVAITIAVVRGLSK